MIPSSRPPACAPRTAQGRLAWPLLAALLLAGGCATIAPPPPPKPPVEAASLPPRFAAEPWSALPGWNDDRVEEAWPAWLVSCRALTARESTRETWQAPCDAAASVDPGDRGAVRRYFETHFTPWSVAFPDGRTTGLVTGYYEPLLVGSRSKTPAFAVPLHAPPDDLYTVELASLYPQVRA